MKDFLISLLDWIYKKKCYFCRSSNECVKMCSKCFESMEPLQPRITRVIDKKPVYCAGVYSKNLQKLIRGLKYHNQRDLALYLAKFMHDYWSQINENNTMNNYQVVPVPIFAKREKQRKYNHMNLVAEEFCRISGCTYNPDLIKRIKDTKPQYKLKKVEREQNLSGAFEVIEENLLPMKILIVDDICTTGATFEEMIKEFENHGVSDITCLAATTPFED